MSPFYRCWQRPDTNLSLKIVFCLLLRINYNLLWFVSLLFSSFYYSFFKALITVFSDTFMYVVYMCEVCTHICAVWGAHVQSFKEVVDCPLLHSALFL